MSLYLCPVAELLSCFRHAGAPCAASCWRSQQTQSADGQMSLERLRQVLLHTRVRSTGTELVVLNVVQTIFEHGVEKPACASCRSCLITCRTTWRTTVRHNLDRSQGEVECPPLIQLSCCFRISFVVAFHLFSVSATKGLSSTRSPEERETLSGSPEAVA